MSAENLYNQEAIDKLKKIVDETDIGMLGTYPKGSEYIHAVPMSRQEVDQEGNIWFLFSSESETYQHLQNTAKVSLLFSDVRNYSFLSINGTAEISQDTTQIEKYWNKMVEGWFDRGKEDPRIRVLKVVPNEAHYWDTKSNKLVTFFKVAARAVTGKNIETGEQGDLNL
ncbi:pyridoxamine 5'-phosphate oxidase family protein [Sphingobacterium haloxyli]|uniref:General stress protein n=1 Tax=Sphingobacterium haloxyli TaxID=2100533 RepID=A0A2S9J7D8_9SPHI|nr:pyridoxamine 5'-phosphate oxidase family protein [Sphingobacterium haloxyli]PRD48681.1 general stress protein [Sphingobacterium haloxyli]